MKVFFSGDKSTVQLFLRIPGVEGRFCNTLLDEKCAGFCVFLSPLLLGRTFLKGLESCVLDKDPLSALLFVRRLETLFIQIPYNDNTMGICVGCHKIKLSAYGDNADFLKPESFESIFQCGTTNEEGWRMRELEATSWWSKKMRNSLFCGKGCGK